MGTTGLLECAVADFMSASINRHTGVNMVSPGLCGLEATAVNWLCHMVGLRASAARVGTDCGGVLTSGGSIASELYVVAYDATVA